jgi:hypothetical protein
MHQNRMYGDKRLVFDRIVKSGLMTSDEVAEHGPAMVKDLDKAGLAKAALASWLQKKKMHDKAIPFWRAAVKATPKKEASRLAYWRWELARSLKALGKLDEAEKELASVNPKRLHRKHRKAFIKFRKNLKKPADTKKTPSKTKPKKK